MLQSAWTQTLCQCFPEIQKTVGSEWDWLLRFLAFTMHHARRRIMLWVWCPLHQLIIGSHTVLRTEPYRKNISSNPLFRNIPEIWINKCNKKMLWGYRIWLYKTFIFHYIASHSSLRLMPLHSEFLTVCKARNLVPFQRTENRTVHEKAVYKTPYLVTLYGYKT